MRFKVAVDTHTHSISSGHAYSSIEEMARAARRRGLRGFVLTDHGPAMDGGTHPYHFGNLRALPERIYGVRLYRGVEANIMDRKGGLDLEPRILRALDFALAGFHELCIAPGSVAENTEALLAALRNPYVDAISHPGNPLYPVDFREVARAARDEGKALEINDSSFRVRKGSEERCPELAAVCAEEGTRVVCGSDAHWSGDLGRLDRVGAVLRAIDFPRALVVNLRWDSFESFLAERRARIGRAGA